MQGVCVGDALDGLDLRSLDLPDKSQIAILSNPFEGEALSRQICTDVFVDFRGYWEDRPQLVPVVNTLETRLELYYWNLVRISIAMKCRTIHEAIMEGEAKDVSGSRPGASDSSTASESVPTTDGATG